MPDPTKLLERAVRGLSPDPESALDRVRRSARRRRLGRRLTAGATALVVAGTCLTYAAVSLHRANHPVRPPIRSAPTGPPSVGVEPTPSGIATASPLPGLGSSTICHSANRPGLITCDEALRYVFHGRRPPPGTRADLAVPWFDLHQGSRLEWWITQPHDKVCPVGGPPRPPPCQRAAWTTFVDARRGHITGGAVTTAGGTDFDRSICEAPDLPGVIGCGEAIRVAELSGPPGDDTPDSAQLVEPRPHRSVWVVTFRNAVIRQHGPGGGCSVATYRVVVDAADAAAVSSFTGVVPGSARPCS